MLASIAKPNCRRGFTLVELLVAAALSILIMAIMATAFQTGLSTLSTLKSLGDMAERLKTAETMLRTDLDAEHFTTVGNQVGTAGDDSPGPLRVSDLRYHDPVPSRPPIGGYFNIFQGGPSIAEGNDADGLLSSRADGGSNHRISMTVKRPSRTPDQLFRAQVPGPGPGTDADILIPVMNFTDVTNSPTTANSRWARVDWFLDTTRPAVLNGVQTWPLIRRVLPIIENPNATVTLSAASREAVGMTASNQVYNMRTIAPSAGRPFGARIPDADARVGDDIVITNVTSFEVRPLYSVPAAGVAYGSIDGIFADLPGGPNAQFDTGSPALGNNSIRVIAVQIKIRVYDPKNKLSRQTTLVVKL